MDRNHVKFLHYIKIDVLFLFAMSAKAIDLGISE